MAIEPLEGRTILLTGPITLYEVLVVRDTLHMALAERTPLRIDLGDSGPWDVAGLQLLISCVKTGRNQDQAVRLVNIPKVCAEVAERSGLADWLHSVQE